jgi:hydrogenase/urease accessory protein HupE
MTTSTLRRRALGCLVVLSLAGASAVAHEIGTTRVSLSLVDPGRYEVEIVTDALALLEKLRGSGDEADVRLDAAALERRLSGFEAVFRQRLTLAFDGTPVRPAIVWSVAPARSPGSGPLATIRLTGDIPAPMAQLTWTYSWTFTPYAFVVHRVGSDSGSTEWLEGGQVSKPVAVIALEQQPSRPELLVRYVVLGFTHILPNGLDHLLFVLGIFLLSRRPRAILLQISAFTVAHSISLALSIYGIVRLPASIVEPAIALSIAYIAIENVFTTDLKPWRYGLVFVFGLLHGLGFAGALAEVGLPRGEFLMALVGFNLGVELGQLTVVALAFATVGYWFGGRLWYRRRIALPASACIALLGIYWTVARLQLPG